jgi:hypothetical protein
MSLSKPGHRRRVCPQVRPPPSTSPSKPYHRRRRVCPQVCLPSSTSPSKPCHHRRRVCRCPPSSRHRRCPSLSLRLHRRDLRHCHHHHVHRLVCSALLPRSGVSCSRARLRLRVLATSLLTPSGRLSIRLRSVHAGIVLRTNIVRTTPVSLVTLYCGLQLPLVGVASCCTLRHGLSLQPTSCRCEVYDLSACSLH